MSNIRVNQIITKDSVGVIISNDNFIGTDCFLISKDIAPTTYINRVEKLTHIHKVDYLKNIQKDIDFYPYSEKQGNFSIYTKLKDIINFKCKNCNVYLSAKYYNYFKKFNLEFRFLNDLTPIGLFKNNKFAGLIMPVRVIEQ